ncbi:histidine phosphatase family protein [Streptomyces sp. SBT349]|uniref:histidine phosphatase family protein n=1 Tax=Streptomyces sp. SBT349 TaxID=1580539 RepID=UPI000D14B557|nr:histidine phosphatase family protein [Streptomyces sp. SBT349]
MDDALDAPSATPCPRGSRIAELLAVRHGESLANVLFGEARRTGSTEPPLPRGLADADVPLSERGEREAAALGRWLASLAPGRRPGTVVCSPYLRARQTWSAMTRALGPPLDTPPRVLVDERLRDREMGRYELHTEAALRARDPEEAERRARVGEWRYRPPGGESLADVALRVTALLADLSDAAAGHRVLVVAHDAVVVALRHVIEGVGAPVPAGLPPVPTASVSRWTGDGTRLTLTDFGSTAHLP